MNTKADSTELNQLINHPRWFVFRGGVMLVLGSVLSLFTITAPNMQMLGTSSSWLPVAAVLIMLTGILRCVDAYAATSKSFLIINLQVSMLDLICGFIILTSVGESTITFSLLITAYLILQGLYRIILTFVLQVPNPKSARMGGGVTILLGLMAWTNWPFSDLWFLSFALSIEVAIRGWALMFYGNAIKKQKSLVKNSET